MDTNFIISTHHILLIVIAIGAIVWGMIKFYLRSFSKDLKESWGQEITNTRKSIEDKKDREIDDLKKTVERDYKNLADLIRSESSTEAIKSKVSDYVSGEFKLIEQDIKQIKDLSGDMKTLLGNQQETLIAIQLNLTELKPRIENLESRVSNLESKKD
jgi:hypothetical protein